jgi:hypothetical protein
VEREGSDAGVSGLSSEKPSPFVTSAEVLDELPDLAVAVDEPGARFALAFGLREQACDKAFADAAFAAGDEDPSLHAVRSSASKALLSLAALAALAASA